MDIFNQPFERVLNKLKKVYLFSFETEQTEPAPASSPEEYTIRTITENDADAVVDHLRKFFFKDEPLNVAVELTNSEKSSCEELEVYSLKSVSEGTSLMAVTSSDRVIGICLNATADSDDKQEEQIAVCSKFGVVKKFLNICGGEGSKAIARQFPDVEKVMLVKIVSTDTAWRGKGIAKKLLDKSRKIGQQLGYGLIRVDCTSDFSAKAVARLGFKCVYSLKYEDYKENGKPVFTTPAPHSHFSVYVQRTS